MNWNGLFLKKGGAKNGFFLGGNSTIGKDLLEQAF